MVRKSKDDTSTTFKAKSKATGRTFTGLHCVGEICFSETGFKVILSKDADIECAKKTAELILGGDADVEFVIPSKGVVKEMTED